MFLSALGQVEMQ